jgi:hypothetical protein
MPRMIMLVACLLSACSTAPAPPVSTPAAAVPAGDAGRDTLIAKGRAMGYLPRQKDGQTVYCKHETPIGSHLPVTTCLTEAALEDTVRSVAVTQQELNRRLYCPAGQCPNR